VVGLGNPGDRYTGTRHNVGFDAVDAFASRIGAVQASGRVRVDKLDCRALTARVKVDGLPVLLAKPQTYMNLSGESVKGLVTKYDVPLDRMMVVYDDVALPVGRIRLRASGSSGGQKGVQSIIDCHQTNVFPRLRIGIAGDRFQTGDDKADYVLSRFSKAERPKIEASVAEACDALSVWMTAGLNEAMNKFNRSSEDEPTSTLVPPSRA
jgi:PTH1 family peptidyl-tRNA hydrolase